MHLPAHSVNDTSVGKESQLHQTQAGTPSCIGNQRRINLNNNGGQCTTGITSVNMNRRKSSISYQHQLQFVSAACGDNGPNCVSSAGRFSPHPNEIYLHQPGKLSIPPIERYEDTATCCLPPPSPAPNSDRYVVGVTTPTQQTNINTSQDHHHQHQFLPQQTHTLSSSNSTSSLSTNSGSNQSCIGTNSVDFGSSVNMLIPSKYPPTGPAQRSLSPNSRYRLERYREIPNKIKHQENVMPNTSAPLNTSTPRFFLPPSTPLPLVSSETYTYLSSTVHTPVKRYVPTPPPVGDPFTDLAQSPAMTSASGSNSSCVVSTQYVNTLPYGYRLKCCKNDSHNVDALEALNTINKSTQSQSVSSGSSASNCSPMVNVICKGRPSIGASQTNSILSLSQQNPIAGSEYSNTPNSNSVNSAVRISTPVNGADETDNQNAIGFQTAISSAGTCLHCNTTRRTTGVHQTTQTTGPISPVPMTQQYPSGNNGGIYCAASAGHEHSLATLTPSTTESHISPLSPAVYIQQPKQVGENNSAFHHHHPQQQQLYSAQQQHKNGNVIVSATSSRIQNANANQQLHHTQQQQLASQTQQQRRYSRKKRLSQYVKKKIARFFGVEPSSETDDFVIWLGRHKRLALRRFGSFKNDGDTLHVDSELRNHPHQETISSGQSHHPHSDRPDILPAHDTQNVEPRHLDRCRNFPNSDIQSGNFVERKASVAHMLMSGMIYIFNAINQRQSNFYRHRQWSRSFAPIHVHNTNASDPDMSMDGAGEIDDGAEMLVEEEMFFDSPGEATVGSACGTNVLRYNNNDNQPQFNRTTVGANGVAVYMSERHHGWRTSAINSVKCDNMTNHQDARSTNASQDTTTNQMAAPSSGQSPCARVTNSSRCNRISAQLLDGVLENSRRPQARRVKFFSTNDLDDRTDHRPFFTYWINTVQIVVLFLSILCYGIAPIGFGNEQKTGQVLVTSLSLQTVQHMEQRNFWIGPRNNDLVHMGAKFAACMRRDVKVIDVLVKTRRHERETACCIRNDDSGCVQSSQADCSVRGLFPTKSISTWKKWSPGESGPGGRISGSVCGLDPKFCDAPASIAPYEWPDDITKWPICRKTNSFSQRFRYKDHTAEHMICEVIGHPCCTGVYGECRITTREYCDFVNGYFHEEASLCSQISCLNNVCGMFPFLSIEVPDQFYRLLTSLCMHAGLLHLAITVVFQHIFLSDLERLIGPIRTAVVYIGSGLAGNLTSAVLVPYKPEVGPSASLCGVIASLVSLILLMHWKQLHKPHVALFKLIMLCAMFFGIGTLPYQLNFAGLLVGAFCGIFLTIALIPFVSVNKYGRKGKINLIWSCVLFHLLLFSTMTIVFYIFPMEFTNLNFGEGMSNSFNPIFTNTPGLSANNDILSGSNSRIVSSISSSGRQSLSQTQKPQYYYHHLSDDIIRNSAALTIDTKIAHLLQSEKVKLQQKIKLNDQSLYFNHPHVYNLINNSSLNNFEKKSSLGTKFQRPKIINEKLGYSTNELRGGVGVFNIYKPTFGTSKKLNEKQSNIISKEDQKPKILHPPKIGNITNGTPTESTIEHEQQSITRYSHAAHVNDALKPEHRFSKTG